MAILGLDWGEKKVGVAVAESILATPLTVIRYNTFVSLVNKLKQIVHDEKITKIIVGVSEGKSKQKSQEFGNEIADILGIQVIFWDETLSSQEAQEKSIQANQSRSKRKENEDAYAAAIILQNFLES